MRNQRLSKGAFTPLPGSHGRESVEEWPPNAKRLIGCHGRKAVVTGFTAKKIKEDYHWFLERFSRLKKEREDLLLAYGRRLGASRGNQLEREPHEHRT